MVAQPYRTTSLRHRILELRPFGSVLAIVSRGIGLYLTVPDENLGAILGMHVTSTIYGYIGCELEDRVRALVVVFYSHSYVR